MRTRVLAMLVGLLLAMSMLPAGATTDAGTSTAEGATGLSQVTGLARSAGLSTWATGLSQAAAAGLSSDNVEYVTTIPIDSPGVSAKVRNHLDTPLLFASGIKGISIYDISDPAAPTPVGFQPLPHSQNEDVQVSEGGDRVVIAADGGLPVPNPVTEGLHVIDTSDPENPQWAAWLRADEGGSNHTAACADADCDWIYGSSGGIFEVVEEDGETGIVEVGEWFPVAEQIDEDDKDHEPLTGSHALNRSVHPDPATGEPVEVLISDSTPRLMMDVSDPEHPQLLTSSLGEDLSKDGLLQHNNQRPNAHFWTPRAEHGDNGNGGQERRGGPPGNVGPPGHSGAPERAGPPARDTQIEPLEVSGNASGQRAAEWGDGWPSDGVSGGDLRPGELMIGNSESNIVPQCDDESGGLTTWDISDFDQGAPMEIKHTFRPVNSAPDSPFEEGDPPANALGCSGHWFDIRDGDNIIAASWYEHGVKIIEIDENYEMEQIGYFQPIATEAGAAYWVVDRETGEEYIYSMDYARGLDILRFHRDPDLQASQAEMARSFSRGAANVGSNVGGYSDAKRDHYEHDH